MVWPNRICVMLVDHSLFDLLFRPVSTPKTHVLNHQIVLFTLNIYRMWYCCVLVCFAGNRRNRAKIRQVAQLWSPWRESHRPLRESHQHPLRPLDATLTDHHSHPSTRVASTWCESRHNIAARPRKGPLKAQGVWKVYLRRSLLRSEDPRFETEFPSQIETESLESRDQEEGAPLEHHWRKLGEEARSQDWEIFSDRPHSSSLIMICSIPLSFTLFYTMCE